MILICNYQPPSIWPGNASPPSTEAQTSHPCLFFLPHWAAVGGGSGDLHWSRSSGDDHCYRYSVALAGVLLDGHLDDHLDDQPVFPPGTLQDLFLPACSVLAFHPQDLPFPADFCPSTSAERPPCPSQVWASSSPPLRRGFAHTCRASPHHPPSYPRPACLLRAWGCAQIAVVVVQQPEDWG